MRVFLSALLSSSSYLSKQIEKINYKNRALTKILCVGILRGTRCFDVINRKRTAAAAAKSPTQRIQT